MKYCFRLITLLVCFCVSLNSIKLYSQQPTVRAKNGMVAGIRNYKSFTAPYKDNNPEAIKANAGYEHHPELGLLFAETPCDNCYELIGKRTEISKTFIKEGTDGRDIMQQTSSAAMHYHDAQGNWRTIKSQLEPGATKGVYAATAQPVPVAINTVQKYASLGKAGENFRFNNNLELIFLKPDGSEISLGGADWDHNTAGDDGVYVTNAWPGVDIEMYTIRGAIKTNYIINHAMPAYASGKLLVRDHLQVSDGLKLNSYGNAEYTGNLEITNSSGERVYAISAATAFEKDAIRNTLQMLEYHINGNVLDIALPGNFLNRPAASYPVIIDPLVSTSTNTTVNGSTYSAGWTTGCVYTNPATVPAKATVTDVQFSFQYVTSGGALLNNGAFDFYLGACRSPSAPTIWWNCNSLLTGTCTGTNASIFPSLAACMPPPQCAPYNLNLVMDFFQNYLSDPPCSNLYITAGSPLNITVFGQTIQSATASTSPTTICQGQTTSLSASAQYGIAPYTYLWMPGSVTGSPVSVSPVTTTVYSVTVTDACGDTSDATTTITVNPVSTISGNTQICVGSSTTLSDISGGTWSSSNTAVATITNTGVVSGVTVGTSVISYITPATCYATTTVTVNPIPAVITGITTVCAGSTTILSDATAGGTWTSGSTTIATVGSASGIVTGVSGGTATITYKTAGGCTRTVNVTVNPLLPITGPTTVCQGNTTPLANATPGGGTWSSTATTVATISSTGVVTGVSAGTSVIDFTTTAGCVKTFTITVLPPPNAITGITTVCQGGTTILSDATAGGTWSSSNSAVAAINVSTGVITGMSGGGTVITYTIGTGCTTTALVTVNPLGPITGTTSVCVGGTTTLNNIGGSGTWTSSNTSVATITAATGVVSGVSTGTTNITYTSFAGCTAATVVNVNLLIPITGTTTVCQGSTTSLSNSTVGGSWSSNNTAVAQVATLTGVVTGISGGTATITYTSAGGCYVTAPVTVNPAAPITGSTVICQGNNTTLSDATPGGTWSCSNSAIAAVGLTTGIVTGVSGGTASIIYTTGAGCTANISMTVVGLPPAITGNTAVCNATTLSDATSGGSWASSNTTIASINAITGTVAGLSTGLATITYTITGGCFVTTTISVNPIAAITGTPAVCAGSIITLSDATTGGTWSSSNTNIATADPTTGTITGVLSGGTTISYTSPAGCTVTTALTVNAIGAISGITTVCQGSTTTLSDTPAGGTWSSGATGIATVGLTSGVVSGVSGGNAAITYSTIAGCTASATVTVNPVSPISGVTKICQGTNTILSDAIAGGTWSSSNTSIATADPATGIIYGVLGGIVNITYTTAAGCITSISFVVNTIPTAIAGNTTVCQGSTTTLSNSIGGGTWSSASAGVATIGISNGVVTALTAGTTGITYSTVAGCSATTTVTVNPITPITGITAVCQGNTTTFSDATPGGTWSASNSAIATIDLSTGIVTGATAGNVNILYTTLQGCTATISVTVNPTPTAIAGNKTVCIGSATTLSNSVGGGTWSSGSTGIATIGITSGIVTGGTAGSAIITYITNAGCFTTTTVTVNPLPLNITGTTSICKNGTTILSDATTGGTWTSGNTSIATISAVSGLLTGVTAGTVTTTYTSPLGCYTTTTVIVNPLPSAITGTPVVCEGATTTLSDALPGGTWSSSNTVIATIGVTTGVMYGIATGATIITYITPAGCFADISATVDPTPAISGFTYTNPTTCVTNNGTITLSGLTIGATYTVSYYYGTTHITIIHTANGSGSIIITGLPAGTYTNITVTSALGCTSNMISGPILLLLPTPPSMPAASSNSPICDGTALQLTATDDTAGVTYSWSGPVGFTSTLQNPAIAPAHVNESGTYTVTATKIGCVSAPAVTTVVINPIPDIAGSSSTNPTTCYGTDGTITLTGLTPGLAYYVSYIYNNNPVGVTITANAGGTIIITGLSSGTYTDITVSSFTCVSNVMGPIILNDPTAPPPPQLGSNSPVCAGATLLLTSTDPVTNLTYSWIGPNGFTSDLQDPGIPNVTLADSGLYSLTISHLNCQSSASENIIVYPPVVLANVTENTIMPYGGNVQLNASGALYYMWTPDNGTLSNPNIYNPTAAPQDTTTYVVTGINEWGCRDSAKVTISISYIDYGSVPTAFTPNGDGKNDVFRIVNQKFVKIIDFSVFDRWGKLVYHNTYNPNEGWDGTYNGVKQDAGVYFYSIIIETPDGKTKYFKGDVTLIR